MRVHLPKEEVGTLDLEEAAHKKGTIFKDPHGMDLKEIGLLNLR
jgi:hypothetical protein